MIKKISELKQGDIITTEYGDYDNWVTVKINKVEKENNEQRTVEQGIEREDTDIRLNSETRTENIDNLLDENVSEDMELNSAQVNDDILDEDINENENFIIKDRIKFELETNYYKNSKIIEEV